MAFAGVLLRQPVRLNTPARWLRQRLREVLV
jgi:hypothetical protein